MKRFEEPVIEMQELLITDVITTSLCETFCGTQTEIDRG